MLLKYNVNLLIAVCMRLDPLIVIRIFCSLHKAKLKMFSVRFEIMTGCGVILDQST